MKTKIISLWTKQDKNGNKYYTGTLGGSIRVVAFPNKKTNEKQPDMDVYIAEPEQQNNNKQFN